MAQRAGLVKCQLKKFVVILECTLVGTKKDDLYQKIQKGEHSTVYTVISTLKKTLVVFRKCVLRALSIEDFYYS